MRQIAATLLIWAMPVPVIAQIQPVVLVAAYRNAPSHTIETLINLVSSTLSVYEKSSYYVYQPIIQGAYGWYQVPSNTQCPGNDMANAAIRAALDHGVQFPNGVKPIVITDCGHYAGTFQAIDLPNSVTGVFTDGKNLTLYYGTSIGLQWSYANNCSLLGCAPFNWYNMNPFSPMSSLGGLSEMTAWERLQKNWLPLNTVVTMDNGSIFLQALELPVTGQPKRLQVRSNLGGGILFSVEARRITSGRNPTIQVHVYSNGNIIDLDTINDCKMYALPVSKLFQRSGYAIRNDGFTVDGVNLSLFQYSGSSTTQCNLTPPPITPPKN